MFLPFLEAHMLKHFPSLCAQRISLIPLLCCQISLRLAGGGKHIMGKEGRDGNERWTQGQMRQCHP